MVEMKMQKNILRHKKTLWKYLIAIGILGGGYMLGILYFHNPEIVSWYPSCVFHDYTGLYCFGCGNTRATYHLLHGNFIESLSYNVMLVPYIALLSCLVLKPEWLNQTVTIYYIVPIVITLFTVLRNMPWEPFCLLAPH